jgi:hypothetical protein
VHACGPDIKELLTEVMCLRPNDEDADEPKQLVHTACPGPLDLLMLVFPLVIIRSLNSER